MAPPVDPELLDTAVNLARQAGELTLQYFRRDDLAIDRKGDGTPVTAADRGAERLIREELEARYPDDGILGEEEAEKVGTSGRRWIIDPIDGTKAFTHGVPLYTNLLAVEDDDGIAVGVINVPGAGRDGLRRAGPRLLLQRRAGLGQRPRPASTTPTSPPAASAPGTTTCILRAKAAKLNLRTWGDGYGYVLVATGRVEAMFDPKAALYDLAPMPVILAEAGGRFTDLDGAPTPGGGSGLATNGRIHDELLAVLNEPT